jgi:hypothetical protein
MTFDIKNSGPGLGQAQKGGGVKPINVEGPLKVNLG